MQRSYKATVTTCRCMMSKYTQNHPTVTWRVPLKLWLQPQRTFFPSIEPYQRIFFKELPCIYIWHVAVRITQALCLFAFYVSVSWSRLIRVAFWNRGRSLSEETFSFQISAAATQKKGRLISASCTEHMLPSGKGGDCSWTDSCQVGSRCETSKGVDEKDDCRKKKQAMKSAVSNVSIPPE